jgi:TPP-dependent pyruvate/acetoin dehydrogenase alpha subunit
MGDGTLGEGIVYESMNMASLWKVPILFILENNRIAQTTPIEKAVAGDIKLRFNSFDIPAEDIESSDVVGISKLANKLIKDVRSSISPHAMIIHTYRFGPHSKGDDTRSVDEIDRMRKDHDPLQIQGQRLDTKTRDSITTKVEREVQKAFEKALDDPFPDPEVELAV